MKYLIFTFPVALFVWSCDNYIPKPRAMLRLDYKAATYKTVDSVFPCEVSVNSMVKAVYRNSHSVELYYPEMKATIYLNYHRVKGDLEALSSDAQKFTYGHVIKAEGISEQAYENRDHRVYGMMYKVGGDAASQTQFYLTDSIRNFVLGSLYFYAEPNYDSILPAVSYIDKDIKKLIETLRWK